MKQGMKQNSPSKNFWICWCTEKKAFDSLADLRTHKNTICTINMNKLLNDLTSLIMKSKAKRKAQHDAGLHGEKEKACGTSKM